MKKYNVLKLNMEKANVQTMVDFITSRRDDLTDDPLDRKTICMVLLVFFGNKSGKSHFRKLDSFGSYEKKESEKYFSLVNRELSNKIVRIFLDLLTNKEFFVAFHKGNFIANRYEEEAGFLANFVSKFDEKSTKIRSSNESDIEIIAHVCFILFEEIPGKTMFKRINSLYMGERNDADAIYDKQVKKIRENMEARLKAIIYSRYIEMLDHPCTPD